MLTLVLVAYPSLLLLACAPQHLWPMPMVPALPMVPAGTRYGLGVYFAVSAALSAHERFSPPSSNGSKFIFMAQVLTGDFVKGSPGLRAPPLRAQPGHCPPRRYHSVVDNSQHPTIFVIFNDTQAYPQYLITCRQCGGAARTPTDPP